MEATRYKGKAEKWYNIIDPDYDVINDQPKEVDHLSMFG